MKYLCSFLTLFVLSPLFAQKVEPTYKQVSYGLHKDMILNFWKIDSKKPTPLLVHIHGGGWLGGKKHETVGASQLKQGYSYASIDYRLAGTELLPAAVHDAARAIQFLRTKAKEWNFDPKRIAVTGGSAGAASSMWLAYHDDMADPKSEIPCFANHHGSAQRWPWAGKRPSIRSCWRRRSAWLASAIP